jgi:pyruvate dehydrogenase E2 component (dihydrolipoamide acetyltransferase)
MSAVIEKLGMPKWGLSMTEGRLLDWLVDEGDEIAVGQEVAEVETEKITGAVEAPAAGVLRRRVAAVGDVVPVGGLLGVIAGAEVADAEIDAFVAEFEAAFVPEEEDAGPEPEIVTVGAGTLRFLRQGDGDEAVLLLHGFGGDLNNWLFNLDALAEGRTVYALDLPGHGGSVKRAEGLGSLTAAVREFLDGQGVERAHLVGHSMGALVAAAIARESPDRVASLTLVDPAGLGEEIDRDYVDGFVAATSRKELKPVLQRLFADPELVTRSMVDDVLKYKRLDGVDEALRSLAGELFPDGHQQRGLDLEAYDGPVLVIWGEQDQVIPAAHADSAPPRAEKRILAGAGHSPHLESAGEFNRLVTGFLSR